MREDAIVPGLDEWIASLFDDDNVDATCEALAMAQGPTDENEARAEAARRKVADCDRRIAKYRALLDHYKADVALTATWIAEVKGERDRAEQELGAAIPREPKTKEQFRMMVLALKDIAARLRKANPKLKAVVYEELGVRVTYDPHRRLVSVSAGPCTTERVGGGVWIQDMGDIPGRGCVKT